MNYTEIKVNISWVTDRGKTCTPLARETYRFDHWEFLIEILDIDV